MIQLNKETALEALRPVQDPELGRSLVDLGMIRGLEVERGRVSFEIVLTTPACPLKDRIQSDCETALRALPGVESIDIRWGAEVRGTPGAARPDNLIPSVKNVVLVASGKGGVGKSTVAANLAIALAQTGARTGLLDADIYGPSMPIMMGAARPTMDQESKKILPVVAHGVAVMSIGYLVDPDTAMVWRGPMLNGAVIQLLRDVSWGEQDYLVVDLPPGTGDVQLTVAQKVAVVGAVVVTTPQVVALADVVRAKRMFDQVQIRTLGVVENMSTFICPECDTRHDIFATGGGERAAGELGVEFLGAVPIDPRVRASGDSGTPLMVSHPDSPAAEALRAIAGKLAGRISIEVAGSGGGGQIPIKVVGPRGG